MPEYPIYPHAVDCYLIITKNGKQSHPKEKPISTEIVYSKKDVEAAKRRLSDKYPGSWCVERPLDWE